MSVEGTWNQYIATPLGRQHAVLELVRVGGVLTGTATDIRHGERVELANVALDGDRLTWTQSITKPMRLNLAFDVTVDGDQLAGRARAGRLPASTVNGQRLNSWADQRVGDGFVDRHVGR